MVKNQEGWRLLYSPEVGLTTLTHIICNNHFSRFTPNMYVLLYEKISHSSQKVQSKEEQNRKINYKRGENL